MAVITKDENDTAATAATVTPYRADTDVASSTSTWVYVDTTTSKIAPPMMNRRDRRAVNALLRQKGGTQRLRNLQAIAAKREA